MSILNNLRAERFSPPPFEPKIVHYRDLIKDTDKHNTEPKATLKQAFLGNCKPLPSGIKLPDYYNDILEAPHTLVAGSTKCGKSTFLHALIYVLMGTYTPREASLVLLDPKRVELIDYRNTKYCIGYASDNKTALELLEDSINLIEDRYTTMQQLGIKEWNGNRTFIIIDELADLLIDDQVGRKVKRALQKILQIGRASGVCIIAATQCPARKIIPAELTLNFTERIGLKCNSTIESRQIINDKGCENIRGYGIALYLGFGGIKTISVPLLESEIKQSRIDYWE